MATRHIRLKEWDPGLSRSYEIAESYVLNCNDSLRVGSVAMKVDSNGFIETGNNFPGEGRAAITLIGDSVVESIYAEPVLRWPAVVERELERHNPGSYSILNGGRSGMTLLHMLGVVLFKLPPLFDQTEKLILFAPSSDKMVLHENFTYWANHQWVDPLLPKAELPASGLLTAPDLRAQRGALWDCMLSFLSSFDVDVSIGAVPFRVGDWESSAYLQRRFPEQTGYTELIETYRQINEDALAAANRFGLKFLAPEPFTTEHEDNERYFYDPVHFNTIGHAKYAGQFIKELFG